MNIVIYSSGGYPFGGAAESFVRNLAEGLHLNSLEVNVFLLHGNYINNFNLRCENEGILFSPVLFKNKIKKEWKKVLELLCLPVFLPFHVLIKKTRFKNEVIILYGIEYPYFILPIIIASKILNIRIYRIVTDQYVKSSIVPTWWKIPKYHLYQLQHKYFDKYFNGIVCLSTFLRDGYLSNGLNPQKLILIPHFIKPLILSVPHFKETKVETIRLCYAGAMIEPNGIIDLLNTVEILFHKDRKYELVLVGDLINTSDVISLKLQQINDKYPDKIIQTGYLKTASVGEILTSCDILINPRQASIFAEAGFPTKLGEYFATKKTVVATKVGDVSKYFTDGEELILAEPNNPESLASKILEISQDKEKMAQIGQRGYEWMMENLHYLKSTAKLLKFIKDTK